MSYVIARLHLTRVHKIDRFTMGTAMPRGSDKTIRSKSLSSMRKELVDCQGCLERFPAINWPSKIKAYSGVVV